MQKIIEERLHQQKNTIIGWAYKLKYEPLKTWAKSWEEADLDYCASYVSFLSEHEKPMKDVLGGQEMMDFFIPLIHYKVAVEAFNDGNFELGLDSVFQAEFFLGCRRGVELEKERAIAKRANSEAYKDTKRIVIRYALTHELYKLSNEQAALMLGAAKLVKLSHRVLVSYMGDIKKFRKLCDLSEAGHALTSLRLQAQQKLRNAEGLTKAEEEHFKAVIQKIEANDEIKIESFLHSGIERVQTSINYWDKDLLKKLAVQN